MMHARRGKVSAAQRAEMRDRWKARQSLHAIGRALGKDHMVLRFLLARHGGIAPAARRRSRRVLTLAECEDISRGIATGVLEDYIGRKRISTNQHSNVRLMQVNRHSHPPDAQVDHFHKH